MNVFRLNLQELGFQAGQHEVLAESYSRIVYRDIEEKAVQVSEGAQNNVKEMKQITDNLERHQQNLDKAKKKYQKYFAESITAKSNFLKADANPTVSRAEIAKLKRTSETLRTQCEDYKGSYASELLKTNKCQAQYYYQHLPASINNLQNIEIDRIDFVKYAMDQCVSAEKDVTQIIEKCREDMKTAIHMIDPVADSELLIDRCVVICFTWFT